MKNFHRLRNLSRNFISFEDDEESDEEEKIASTPNNDHDGKQVKLGTPGPAVTPSLRPSNVIKPNGEKSDPNISLSTNMEGLAVTPTSGVKVKGIFTRLGSRGKALGLGATTETKPTSAMHTHHKRTKSFGGVPLSPGGDAATEETTKTLTPAAAALSSGNSNGTVPPSISLNIYENHHAFNNQLNRGASMPPPAKSGVLYKYTNVVRGWQPRWCVLEHGVLFYAQLPKRDDNITSEPPTGNSSIFSIGDGENFARSNSAGGAGNLVVTSFPISVDEKTKGQSSVKDSSSFLRIPSFGRKQTKINALPANIYENFTTLGTDSRDRTCTDSPVITTQTQNSVSYDLMDIAAAALQASQSNRKRVRKRIINLMACIASPDDADDTKFTIDAGSNLYHFKATSPQERDAWLRWILASIQFFQDIVHGHTSRKQDQHLLSNRILSYEDEQDTTKQTPADSKILVTPNATPGGSKIKPSKSAKRVRIAMKDSIEKSNLSNSISADQENDMIYTEDDGLIEAKQCHEFLISQFTKTLQLTGQRQSQILSLPEGPQKNQELLELFHSCFNDSSTATDNKNRLAEETLKNFVKTVSLALNVLQTEENMWTRMSLIRLAAGDPLERLESSEDEFFDAYDVIPSFALPAAQQEPTQNQQQQQQQQVRQVQMLQNKTSVSMDIGKVKKRSEIPLVTFKRPSIWSVLKDAVGKDLSRFSIPVMFNEPLSFLQKMVEDLEYSELLDQATECEDPYKRILLVATLALSHYSSIVDRLAKPFNPLLGETFDFIDPDKGKGIRVVCEQVGHHPPVGVIHGESKDREWLYYAAIEVKNKFWGKSLEVFPTGYNHVLIPKFNDHYTYQKVTTCIHNIITGNVWLDNYGDLIVQEHNAGIKCVVKLHKTGWLSDSKLYATVKGQVYHNQKAMNAKLWGTWKNSVDIEIDGKQERIWTVIPRPPREKSAGFHFTSWGISLNAPIPLEQEEQHAPTDSRFRPDQRGLEEGRIAEATEHKNRIEHAQRVRRKQMEAAGKSWKPRWFELKYDPLTKMDDWIFTGEYFEHMKSKDWSMSPEIF